MLLFARACNWCRVLFVVCGLLLLIVVVVCCGLLSVVAWCGLCAG